MSEQPGIYRRLWFHREDRDQSEVMEEWARKGWFLCAVEPAEDNACWYWLREMR